MTDDIKTKMSLCNLQKIRKWSSKIRRKEEVYYILFPLIYSLISDRQIVNSLMEGQALLVPKNSWFSS